MYGRRFKSLPTESDDHLVTLLGYAERNPVRADLIGRAADWRCGLAAVRHADPAVVSSPLSAWPVEVPRGWKAIVDRPQTDAEVDSVCEHVRRPRPVGNAEWMKTGSRALGLDWTIGPRGRPTNAARD